MVHTETASRKIIGHYSFSIEIEILADLKVNTIDGAFLF
jgi:hypothetical protein